MEEKITLKQRAIKLKDGIVAKVKRAVEVIEEHEGVSVALITTLGGLGAAIISGKVAKDEIALKLEDRRSYTDPNTNITWALTRKPTNIEKAAIAKVVREKGNVEEILRDFNLIY